MGNRTREILLAVSNFYDRETEDAELRDEFGYTKTENEAMEFENKITDAISGGALALSEETTRKRDEVIRLIADRDAQQASRIRSARVREIEARARIDELEDFKKVVGGQMMDVGPRTHATNKFKAALQNSLDARIAQLRASLEQAAWTPMDGPADSERVAKYKAVIQAHINQLQEQHRVEVVAAKINALETLPTYEYPTSQATPKHFINDRIKQLKAQRAKLIEEVEEPVSPPPTRTKA